MRGNEYLKYRSCIDQKRERAGAISKIRKMRKEIIGNATLYLGDSRDILPGLLKMGAVITDPPYGIGFEYEASYKDKDGVFYQELLAPLKGLPLALLQYPEEMMRLVVPVLGAPDDCLVWCYNSNLPRQSRLWGFWGLRPDWSRVKQFAKNPESKKVTSLLVNSYDWLSDIQQVKNVSEEKTKHPCQLPTLLVERVITLVNPESVVDPFMGSGTTGVASMLTGKQFIGIEIEPKYFDIACERIENAQRQGNMFEEGISSNK